MPLFPNWKVRLALGMLLCVPIASSFVLGRYVYPDVPTYCDAPPPDCKLQESRAIEGCEQAAIGVERELRFVSYNLADCESRIDEAKVWFTRANQCAALLNQLLNNTQKDEESAE